MLFDRNFYIAIAVFSGMAISCTHLRVYMDEEIKNEDKGCRMTDVIIKDKDGQIRCGELIGAVDQSKIEITRGGVNNEKNE